ncbi:2TM domain-containing protein [Lutibacter sp.]
MNEQHELYENARSRVQQKKRLYFHFILFLVGSIFFIVLNKVFNLDVILFENWFIWTIVLWFFFLVLHFINVFITNRFMGKDWERKQIDKLVLKQELKIAKLEKEIAYEAKLKAESEQYAAELKKKKTPQDNQAKE